jgi:hypothetical protein
MEEEVKKLHKCLQDKDEQLRTSICSTEQVIITPLFYTYCQSSSVMCSGNCYVLV